MTDDTRWAARYALCEELWRDQPRVIWDGALSTALLGPDHRVRGVEARAPEGGLAALLADLVPRRASERDLGRVDVWMGVRDEAVGRRLAPRRPGTQFLTLAPLCDAIRRRQWSVAFIDLSDLLVSDGLEQPARLSARGHEMVDALASRASASTTVVVSAAARGVGDPVGLEYDGIVELAETISGGRVPVRVYGLLEPRIVAAVELSEPDPATLRRQAVPGRGIDDAARDRDDEARTVDIQSGRGGARRGSGAWRDGKPRAARWSGQGEHESTSAGLRTPRAAGPTLPGPDAEEFDDFEDLEDSEDLEEVPLAYDNTLGDREPTILHYIALIGEAAQSDVADGMTLVELPSQGAAAFGSAEAVTDRIAPSPLRAQLQESRRQADLSAIERQGLVERLDDVESTNVTLQAEVASLRDALAHALAPGPGVEDGAGAPDGAAPSVGVEGGRLDEAVAQLQSLRWQLAQTQRALDAARARPVEALEAEVARLKRVVPRPSSPGQVSPSPTGLSDTAYPMPVRFGRPSPAKPCAERPLLAEVDALLHRVERSDISALELRRQLLAVRAGLAQRLLSRS